MTIFSEELRRCLNAAGLSDCGENDCWNYWYERIMASFNEAVDRATRTERAENAKLRELCADMYKSMDVSCQFGHAIPAGTMAHVKNLVIGLGIEVDE